VFFVEKGALHPDQHPAQAVTGPSVPFYSRNDFFGGIPGDFDGGILWRLPARALLLYQCSDHLLLSEAFWT
jgi:hypothetical protein